MARIKLTVDFPVKDGTNFMFRTPCDCTAVDGLTVQYPVEQGSTQTTSTNFLFKDAHGNTLTSVGNLFTSGVLIKVMLDVSSGFAFIQNADTNKYLEDALSAASTGVYEQNENGHMTFWIGTQAEYNAITNKKHNCLYLIEDEENKLVNAPVLNKVLWNSEVILPTENSFSFPLQDLPKYNVLLIDGILYTRRGSSFVSTQTLYEFNESRNEATVETYQLFVDASGTVLWVYNLLEEVNCAVQSITLSSSGVNVANSYLYSITKIVGVC